MSKNTGGKYISGWHNVMSASFSSSSNLAGSRTLLHMTLKEKHSRVMACLTLLGKMSCMATTYNCCIKTWKSWDFKLTNFRSFNCIRLLIFEEYPCGTLTWRRHWQKLIFSFLDKVWQAGGKYIFLASYLGCNWARIPISARSWWVFKQSLVLPWMLRSVSMTPSHIFFPTCITSIQCLTSRLDQYGRSNNIDLFFHMQLLLFDFFWVFPNIVLMSSTHSRTYWPINGIGIISCSWLPWKSFFNHR